MFDPVYGEGMDRRQLLKSLALVPVVAALPVSSGAAAPVGCGEDPNVVHLHGTGEWVRNVDLRSTLLSVLTLCVPCGIVSGTVRIVPVAASTSPEELPGFDHVLPAAPDLVACDVVATRWLAHRDRLVESIGEAVAAHDIIVDVRILRPEGRPRWPKLHFDLVRRAARTAA